MSAGGDLRASIGAVALVLASVGALVVVQPRLASNVAGVKASSDIYPLPEIDQLPLFTLGYNSAAADAIWAQTLVVQGLRLHERRHFDHGSKYFRSILALDPSFRTPYLYVDAVLTFGAVRAPLEDIVAAREILEAGVAARPYDAEIAYQAGSFIAYVAPGYLRNEPLAQAWERDGAAYLARAAELGSSNPTIQALSLSGATLLSKRGQRAAAISMLERAFAVAPDDATRLDITNRLRAFRGEEEAAAVRDRVRAFESAWRADLPFVSLTKEIVLGPPVAAFACVGAGSRADHRCRPTWGARLDGQ
jgi:tetratricopeptide (TPR) repeat protein